MPRLTVERYLESLPEAARAALVQVRDAIRGAVPAAEEVISYGMPTYLLEGERLLHVAAWKNHYALYGATAPLLDALGAELAAYDLDKGTIRFALADPVPAGLIARIAAIRAGAIRARTT